MACTTPPPAGRAPAPVYTPEQVKEITQRYYSKGLLFRGGKLGRQMHAIREQCATARAMDDGHKQRELVQLGTGLLTLVCFWIGAAVYTQQQEAARQQFSPALNRALDLP